MIGKEMDWLRQQDKFAANSISDFGKIMDSGIEFLSLEDRDIPFHQLNPQEKRRAYVFYCEIRNGYMPDVDEDNWICLGFCTARDQEDVQRLAYLYGLLVKRCKFDEFWKAMAESTIVELFHKYGLGCRVTRLRNFKIVMGAVGKWHQSVWELKRFTRVSDAEPTRAVAVDYGFMNCQSPQERIDLSGIYTKFFSRSEDEMNLHQACIEGRLAPFLVSVLGQLPVPAELLSNPYPLDNCGYMGMVAESVVACPESMYQVIHEEQQAKGEKGVVLTIPDECDGKMVAHARERAAFLTGCMSIASTKFRGMTITSISAD
jgi:hypothetical protein